MKRKLISVLITIFGLVVLVLGIFLLTSSRSFEVVRNKLGTIDLNIDQGTALPNRENSQNNFSMLWYSDFDGNRIVGLSPLGKIIWEQNMDANPVPAESYNVQTEYVTLAPNGNLIVSDGDGMMVQELDRQTHQLLWQYGLRSRQGATAGLIDQPDKSYKINDHEVLINDGNNRRVIIVDQNTNQIVWQYGHTLEMSGEPGYLHGNTSARPLNGGTQIIITDTLEKKIMIVDHATKNILWEYKKPDSKWLEHVFPTEQGTFVLEDRQNNEVFEVNRDGKVLWTLNKFADGETLKYPTDTIKLANGDVLVAEAGRNRIVEVEPINGKIINQWGVSGYITTIALDFQSLPEGNQIFAGKSFVFVGPRGNIATSSPDAYGFWSFAVSVKGILSRSGQPTIEDFAWLKKSGWKSVIDLRVDGERGEVGDDTKISGFNELGFNYLASPMADGSPPTDAQAQKFLEFVTNSANQPAHVHCRGGIGRTGVMVALYRYSVQGWPWLKAVDESKLFQGGISDPQKNWLERWAQNHAPGSFGK